MVIMNYSNNEKAGRSLKMLLKKITEIIFQGLFSIKLDVDLVRKFRSFGLVHFINVGPYLIIECRLFKFFLLNLKRNIS